MGARAALRVIASALLLGGILPVEQVLAQTEDAPPAPVQPAFSAAQLDQMLAPIALYPDELLGQILTAATYPLEVVQADRWLQDPANAALRGTQLVQALQPQPWDASVKSLVAAPQILSLLDSRLDWTEQLGDAFLAQQADVMDSVQRLRGQAQAAGTLASTPQQIVTHSDQAIEIAPADSGTDYVPVYDPQVAYGAWPDPDYPPDEYFVPGYPVGSYIGFVIVVPYWGWHHWHWRDHGLDVGDAGGAPTGGFRPSPVLPRPWRHDPAHRGGVPYGDPATLKRYAGAPDLHSVGSAFRGYGTAPPAVEPVAPARRLARPSGEPPVFRPAVGRPAVARSEVPRPSIARPEVPRPGIARPEAPRPAAPVVERPPPVVESYGRGEQVRAQEQRGASSRMSAGAGGGRVNR